MSRATPQRSARWGGLEGRTNPTVPPAVVLCTSQVSHVDRRTPWRGKIAFTYHEPLTPFEQVGNAYLLVLWRTDNGARRNLRTRMKRVLITHIPFLWSRDSFFIFFFLFCVEIFCDLSRTETDGKRRDQSLVIDGV